MKRSPSRMSGWSSAIRTRMRCPGRLMEFSRTRAKVCILSVLMRDEGFTRKSESGAKRTGCWRSRIERLPPRLSERVLWQSAIPPVSEVKTMDRLEAMSLLVSSAEAGSFSAAGRKLGVALPTISRKVADLEAHLKTRLLVRSGRRLGLTEAGVAYVEACRRILKEITEAESHASGEYDVPRGELTVTAPVVFGRLHVLPVVCEFLAAFDEIRVRMALTDRNLNLVDDQIDMAVRIGELPDNRQIATRVGTV